MGFYPWKKEDLTEELSVFYGLTLQNSECWFCVCSSFIRCGKRL